MNRREAIQQTALALGYAISAPALAGILQGCKPSPELSYKPVFLNEDQARLVSEVAEIILPRTSTPGATDVGVPGFIDVMLKEVYPKNDQDSFLKGLAEFDDDANKTYGHHFVDCEPAQRLEHVKKHNEAALKESAREPTSVLIIGTRPPSFILVAKELTLLGFFTSQTGATEVLQYNAVPGPYRGCVPLTEVGKTWAT